MGRGGVGSMFRKELSYYFSSPIAYIVLGLYLLAVSLFLWVIPGQYNVIESGYVQLDGLFQLSPWLFMLLCPALTMRLFAEERQRGTWDLLMTKPVSLTRVVLAKYLAAWVLLLIGLLPCLTHFVILSTLAEPIGNVDMGQFFGAWLGLVLLSGSFLAIGLLMASLTKSQIVAFILGALACFVLYWVCLQDHYTSISRGVIDLRDVVFFITIAVVAVLSSMAILYKLTHK